MHKLLRFLKATVFERREEYDVWHIGTILFPILAIIFFYIGGGMVLHGLSALLIFVGLSLNRIVVFVNNGKMPVYFRHPKDIIIIQRGDEKHIIMGKNSHLRWLGDIIHLEYLGGFHTSISVGDILQFLGIGLSAFRLLGWF